MTDYYLDFEKPLKEIDQKIVELETDSTSSDHKTKTKHLILKKKKLEKVFFQTCRDGSVFN